MSRFPSAAMPLQPPPDPAPAFRSGDAAFPSWVRAAARLVVMPGLFYMVAFCLLTWPAVQLFSTHILGDEGDALQNVWNIWWVNKAVTQLHTSPWHTSYLHYPYGTTLLGHTLNPFNGFMGIILLRFLTLTETYNVVVLFSYVAAGITAFLLAYRVTGFYFGGIVAGYIYTFANYHVAHTQGHLNLVSLEWIPLFLFYFWILLTRSTISAGVGAAISLLLVILCDYYYFLYCVIAGVLLFVWRLMASRRTSGAALKPLIRPTVVFMALTAMLTGPLVLAVLITNHSDPFVGNHDPTSFSLDLLSPFTPDRWSRLSSWMPSTWINQANIEQVAYIGVSVTIMTVYAVVQRRRFPQFRVGLWLLVALVFAFFSLGPVLHVAGNAQSLPLPLPYTLLGDVIPPLSVGGVPSRMIVITMVSLAVLSAAGLRILMESRKGRWLAVPALLVLLCIELLPGGLPESQMAIPTYVQALRSFPDEGPLVNMVDGSGWSTAGLYYQTVLNRPMAFGYISRVTTSVSAKDSLLSAYVVEMRNDILYQDYGFKYLVVPATVSFPFDPVAYQDSAVRVYRLGSESRGVRVETVLPFVWGDDFMHDVLPGSIAGQTFTATYNGLRAIGLVLSKNYQTPTGPLIFHLQDAAHVGRGPDLVTITLPSSTIADGYLHVFSFTPLPHSRGHHYYAYLEAPRGTSAESMWVWGSGSTAYTRGTLMIDHREATGNLVMQLFYTKP